MDNKTKIREGQEGEQETGNLGKKRENIAYSLTTNT